MLDIAGHHKSSLEHEHAEEQVDWYQSHVARPYSQTPRPMKECMKLAYLWTSALCSSVGARTSRKMVIAPALCG